MVMQQWRIYWATFIVEQIATISKTKKWKSTRRRHYKSFKSAFLYAINKLFANRKQIANGRIEIVIIASILHFDQIRFLAINFESVFENGEKNLFNSVTENMFANTFAKQLRWAKNGRKNYVHTISNVHRKFNRTMFVHVSCISLSLVQLLHVRICHFSLETEMVPMFVWPSQDV